MCIIFLINMIYKKLTHHIYYTYVNHFVKNVNYKNWDVGVLFPLTYINNISLHVWITHLQVGIYNYEY